MRRKISLCAVAVVLVLVRQAGAQTVRGAARDSVTRFPVAGVVVSLLDSSGKTLTRALTNERGEFGMRRSDQARRVRAQRLGYRMREIELPATFGDDAVLEIALLALPALLDPVRVVANPLCPHLANQDDVFGLLQAARNGVLTTVVGREANPGTLVRSEFERRIDPQSGRILSQTVQRDSAVQTPASFFTARTGEEFVRLGFTDPKPAGSDYMGLTADLLMDDGFTTGYCFRIVAADQSRPNQIGLGFTAPSHRSERVDVDGVLWMDTVTRSLRDMVYRYVARSAQDIRASGRTSFLEMANGVVLVDQWSIRMMGMAMDTTAGKKLVPTPRTIEGGGALLHATWPDGTRWRAPLGTAIGLARLHGSDTAVANLTLMLVGTNYWTVTDAKGRYLFDDLLPGPYSVDVVDPDMRDIGLLLPTTLTFSAEPDSVIETSVPVPTAADYVRNLCRKNKDPSGPVTVLGRVFDADARPVEGAEALFSVGNAEPFFKIKTAVDGLFFACLDTSRSGEAIDVRVRRRGDIEVHELRTVGEKATILKLTLLRSKP